MFGRISKHRSRALVFAFSVSILCLTFPNTVSAQQGWNKKTQVTFNVPVEIPGISAQVLPAGTYVFRLMDSVADRHIVQILNKDETHLYANILAIPNYRLRPTDKTVMTFSERRAGEPQAIRAWFYPGDNSGQEFVYPKKRAVELAKITDLPVLFIPEEVAPNIAAPVTRPTEPAVAALTAAPVMAVTPAGTEIPLAEVVTPPPVQIAAVVGAPQVSAAVLPKTAGFLPLMALMGLLCVGVAISLRTLCTD